MFSDTPELKWNGLSPMLSNLKPFVILTYTLCWTYVLFIRHRNYYQLLLTETKTTFLLEILMKYFARNLG